MSSAKVASVKEFVRLLAKREAAQVEGVLCHLIDKSIEIWGAKSREAWQELRDSSKTEEELQEVKERYDHATEQFHMFQRMRHGVGITKRIF